MSRNLAEERAAEDRRIAEIGAELERRAANPAAAHPLAPLPYETEDEMRVKRNRRKRERRARSQ